MTIIFCSVFTDCDRTRSIKINHENQIIKDQLWSPSQEPRTKNLGTLKQREPRFKEGYFLGVSSPSFMASSISFSDCIVICFFFFQFIGCFNLDKMFFGWDIMISMLIVNITSLVYIIFIIMYIKSVRYYNNQTRSAPIKFDQTWLASLFLSHDTLRTRVRYNMIKNDLPINRKRNLQIRNQRSFLIVKFQGSRTTKYI